MSVSLLKSLDQIGKSDSEAQTFCFCEWIEWIEWWQGVSPASWINNNNNWCINGDLTCPAVSHDSSESFCLVRLCRRSVPFAKCKTAAFLGISHAHYPEGTGNQYAKKCGTLCMRAHGMRNSNQILHGDQRMLEEKFYRVDHGACLGQKFITWMLKRDLYAVANLVFLATDIYER